MDILAYILAAISALVVIIAVFAFKKRKAGNQLKQRLKNSWGNTHSEKYGNEDMASIKGYFDNLREAEETREFLDDITWNDLDMDSIFKRVNHTKSTVGEEYLYAMLREPVTDDTVLKQRSRLADYFSNHPEERNQLQYLIVRLGKKRFAGISNYFFSKAGYAPFRRNRYILQLVLFLCSPFLIIANPSMGILLLVAMFLINMTTHYKAKNEMSAQLDSMSYMVNLITYSIKIADFNARGLEGYTEALKRAASRFKSTGFKSFYQIFYNTDDPFLEYFKIIFLVELISFETIHKKISRNRGELRTLFETVGLLDSMASVASFRKSVPYYAVPDLYKAKDSRRPAVNFDEIYHPLIEDPVANSLHMDKPVLVTGSNASGKSTFLKTAAINTIFAQTIHTCLARKYESCFFRIYTSMALRDNLQDSESYYIAEIKSLKRILDKLNDELPLFCVIDEVLRGTNTIERIAASSEVMRYLAGKNCICLTATHDVELVTILEGLFDNYHFQEQFQEQTILFDYRIYPGKSNTRNAIKLLEIMGYPEETVAAANKSARQFEKEGTWSRYTPA